MPNLTAVDHEFTLSMFSRFGLRVGLWTLISIFLLASCAQRTVTLVPAFSGQVIDASSSAPLEGVLVTDSAQVVDDASQPPLGDWRAGAQLTDASGRFAYAAVERGDAMVPIAPGSGYPIMRRVTFVREGYKQRTCRKDEFSLFGSDQEVRIGLQPSSASGPGSVNSVFVRVAGGVSCQAQVGDAVSDIGDVATTYVISKITSNEANEPVFVLRRADGLVAEQPAWLLDQLKMTSQ